MSEHEDFKRRAISRPSQMVHSGLHDRALPAHRLLGVEAREVLDEWTSSPAFDACQ